MSTKSEWRAASSGGRVISAAASHPGASASACNVTRVLSTAPTMTARIGPPDFGAVDALPREYPTDGFQYDPHIDRDRGMIDIPEVKRQLFLAAEACIPVHLLPARQPRPHQSAPDAAGTHPLPGVAQDWPGHDQ